MKIGLDIYLWMTESLCTSCTDVEQSPRICQVRKICNKVHYQFCTEGVGGEYTPTCVYKRLKSGRLLFCSGYTWPKFPLRSGSLIWSMFGTNNSIFKIRSSRPCSVLDDWGNLTPQRAAWKNPTWPPPSHLSLGSSSWKVISQKTGSLTLSTSGAESIPLVFLFSSLSTFSEAIY